MAAVRKPAPFLALFAVVAATAVGACKTKSSPPASAPTAGSVDSPATVGADGTIRVAVARSGYTPASINAPAGKPVTLIFRRTDDVGCGDEVVFPKQNIRKPLPLNQDVSVTITPTGPGEISFTCGMGMFKGALVIAPS